MKDLFSYFSPYKRRMLCGLLIKVVGTLGELVIPMILTYMLDSVISTMKIGLVVLYGVLMLICSVCVVWMLNIKANRMASKVASEIAENVRRDLFNKTLHLSARATDKFTIPSLESRITSDTYNFHSFINMVQRMGVRAPILLIGGVAVAFIIDYALALVMIATLPLIFIIVYFVTRMGVPIYNHVNKSVDEMVRIVREDAQGIRVIKSLSKEAFENRRFEERNRELSNTELKVGIIMGLPSPVMTLLMNLGICGVILVSAYRVSDGLSSPASVIAFMQYFTIVSMAYASLRQSK